MLVEAKKVKDGFLIPMLEPLKDIQQASVLMDIELVDAHPEFAESEDFLATLADEALIEHPTAKTTPLDLNTH